MRYLVVSKTKNQLFVRGWDRKSIPRDQHLSPLGKPHDENQ